MSDLAVTASQVVAGVAGTETFETLYAGEAIAVGEGYYQLAADLKAYRALNDTAVHAALRGICVAGAAGAGQKMVGQRNMSLTLGSGAAPAVGTPYFVSANAGKFCPVGDLGSGVYVSLAGFGDAVNALKFGINNTGIAHA